MLSLQNSISIYDAIYVSFAVQSKSKLVTADPTLATRIKPPETKTKLTSLAELDL